ncbi:hypothetical protein F5148DRAFT_1156507 [Russula earlei]|uniref:Uncharacterized protein n=1 Tax=Russula earlei TaxID=71964 RepID=A0ACC0UPY3_9AGAM|nr:hypothetical protein F5148DRAFT_1156507 [Russula earlei]
MTSSPPPPPYSESESPLPGPLYSPQQPLASASRSRDTSLTFRIGLHELQDPLVQTKHLRLHLLFLGALHDLRRKVESVDDGPWPPLIGELDGEQRWSWFVNLAVERFQRWIEYLPPPSKSNTFAKFVRNDVPPLDVWMVLHAYLLNPQSFAEDSIRLSLLKPLAKLTASLSDFFFDVLDTITDMILWKPCSNSRSNWVSKTGLPFDPFESVTILLHQELPCPKCRAAVSVPYITAAGTGYVQKTFSHACPSCAFEITREKLAVAKLTTDLTAHLLCEPQAGTTSMQLFLPYTLRTEIADDTLRATSIKQDMLNLKPISQFNTRKWRRNQDACVAMAESLNWKISEIRKSTFSLPKPKLGAKILGAYYNQRPFSVELVGAVLRQGFFIKKINELGWTSPSYFEKREDAIALHYATIRYHAFLDLLSSSQDARLVVPTLDIDLVWHSHQLSGPRYHKDCKTNVGRYIDHNDKIEQFHLSDAFDATCRAWEKRYGVPYTQCGCPLPGNTISQRLARLIPHAGSRNYPLSRLAPPADQPDILAASHPSDHNTVAVLGLPSNTTAKAQREGKAFRRREREASRVRKGEITQEEFERNGRHATPFLVSIPLTPGTATAPVTPLGQVINTDNAVESFAGCATVCPPSFHFCSMR